MLPSALLLLIYLETSVGTSPCYYPSGDLASTDIPCNSSGNSTCCGVGFVCLSNGLCQDPQLAAGDNNTYSRGSCTDQTFTSSSCPKFCVDSALPHQDILAAGQQVLKCPNSDSNYYCNDVDVNQANCNTGADILSLGAPSPVTTITLPTIATSIGTTVTETPTSAPTSPATTSSSPPPSSPSFTSTHAVEIGAAVGGFVILLLLVALAWFIFYRRRTAMELEEVYKGPPRTMSNSSQTPLSVKSNQASVPKINVSISGEDDEGGWPLTRGRGRNRGGSVADAMLPPRKSLESRSRGSSVGEGGWMLADGAIGGRSRANSIGETPYGSPDLSGLDLSGVKTRGNSLVAQTTETDRWGENIEMTPAVPRRPNRPELRESETRFISGIDNFGAFNFGQQHDSVSGSVASAHMVSPMTSMFEDGDRRGSERGSARANRWI